MKLNQLAGSINRLVEVNTKHLKVEKEDRLALQKFRKEEAEADWKYKTELAELHMNHKRNLSYQALVYSSFSQMPTWNKLLNFNQNCYF